VRCLRQTDFLIVSFYIRSRKVFANCEVVDDLDILAPDNQQYLMGAHLSVFERVRSNCRQSSIPAIQASTINIGFSWLNQAFI